MFTPLITLLTSVAYELESLQSSPILGWTIYYIPTEFWKKNRKEKEKIEIKIHRGGWGDSKKSNNCLFNYF